MSLDLDAGLARLGYASFRPGQREAVETLLAGGRLLLVAPTGGGKSLVYQLPAILLPGTTLVISPLVSLMHDQVQALRGARRECHVPRGDAARSGTAARVWVGFASGAFKLAYVAPERLVYPGFQALLRELSVPLLAVDEAHCISEWGHDFRPEYLEIGRLVQELQPPRVLACTATATPIVRDEILARLGLPPDTPQLLRGFARPNLALRAREARSARERERCVDAVLAEALGKPGAQRGTAIVYTMTRRSAEEEAARLARGGWRAAAYHAGMDGASRDKAQRRVHRRDTRGGGGHQRLRDGHRPAGRTRRRPSGAARVARGVLPGGRPGGARRGRGASACYSHGPGDMALRRRLLESGGDDGQRAAVVEHRWNLFLELMRWAEGGSCRHDAILRYFGDEAETLAGCGRCDVCRDVERRRRTRARQETTLVVRKALSAVARVHRRFGLTAAVKLLAGTPDPRLERTGLDRTPTFGALEGRGDDWLTRLLRRCVTAGFVDFTPGERPVVLLTDAGRAVMKGETPARLVLPRERGPGLLSAPAGSARRRASRASAEALPPEAEARFDALRRLRLEIAREEAVPAFVVASDRTLRDLALLQPRTLAELQNAYGIGAAKAERYGERFLAVLRLA